MKKQWRYTEGTNTLCPKNWSMAITLSKLNRFSKFFYRWKEEELVSVFHYTQGMLPHYLWKIKVKFATSWAPGRRLVNLLWYPSTFQSLASRCSSFSTQECRSTAAIIPTCSCPCHPWSSVSCRSSRCPWCATWQAAVVNKTRICTPNTRHCAISWAVNTRFHSSRSVAAE